MEKITASVARKLAQNSAERIFNREMSRIDKGIKNEAINGRCTISHGVSSAISLATVDRLVEEYRNREFEVNVTNVAGNRILFISWFDNEPILKEES